MCVRTALLVAVLSTATACAQRQRIVVPPMTTDEPAAQPTPTVQTGTRFLATLDAPANVGDRFYATVQTPVVDEHGVELVPAGAKVMGRVSGDPAAVSLDVQEILIGGTPRQLSARIVTTDAQSTNSSRRMISEKTVVGLLAGAALIGAIFAGATGVMKTGTIGAGAGGLTAGTTPSGTQLPTGTPLAVETTAPLQVGPPY
jgi:hypothetical protein